MQSSPRPLAKLFLNLRRHFPNAKDSFGILVQAIYQALLKLVRDVFLSLLFGAIFAFIGISICGSKARFKASSLLVHLEF